MRWCKNKPDREGYWWYSEDIGRRYLIPIVYKVEVCESAVSGFIASERNYSDNIDLSLLDGYWSDTPIGELAKTR